MHDHRQAERIAADWIARKSDPGGHWSLAEQDELDAWLRQSVAHRVAYLRLETAWSKANKLRTLGAISSGDEVPPPGAWSTSPFFAHRPHRPGPVQTTAAGSAHPARDSAAANLAANPASWSFTPRPRAARSPSMGRVAVAACLAAALGLTAAVGGWYATGREQQQLHTALGVTGATSLSDGSVATLSSDSEVDIRMSRGAREIDLKRGEAYFQVAKDPRRPFVVKVEGVAVTAVGTRFAVRRAGDEVRLVVTEGTVRLDAKRAGNRMPSATFTAGAIARVTGDGIRVQSGSVEQAQEALGWLSGDVVFHGNTLQEAVAEFNRFNTRQLVIRDPEVARLKIDGSFKVANVEGFSRLLEQTFPVQVIRQGQTLELHHR